MISPSLMRISFEVALRNLFLHKVRTLVVGGILAGCTLLLAVGMSMLQSIEESMRKSIVGTVTGDVQVYSSEARDPLSLFGGGFAGKDDNGQINSFASIKEPILAHPNVTQIIPMGFDMALLSRGNVMDETFDALRSSFKNANDLSENKQAIETAKIAIELLKEEQKYLEAISSEEEKNKQNKEYINSALEPSFWDNLLSAADKEPFLQFLETKVAPISGEKSPVYLRFMGTDVKSYEASFEKFKLIKGRSVAEGASEILLNQKFYDDFVRNIAARYMDKLEEGILVKKNKISDSPELKTMTTDLPKQATSVYRNIFPDSRTEVLESLKKFLGKDVSAAASGSAFELDAVLREFFTLDDSNAIDRIKFFKNNIAPKMKLYEIEIGESITLRSYSKRGYLRSASVKVVGTFGFSGIEKSDLAGVFNIVDLSTFRDLYGQLTQETLSELSEMKKQVNINTVSREDAESSLFGDGSSDVAKPATTERELTSADGVDLIINAAIILKDPTKIKKTLESLSLDESLSKLKLKFIDWKDAAGMVGKFVSIVRIVLFTSVGVIFVVALVIINNSMVMATVERTQEIGTIRALGGQKSFVLFMFLTETFVTSFAASILGISLATILILFLGDKGIPANINVLTFLFGGPRLYPSIDLQGFILAPLVISLTAVVSTFYPALLAAGVSPAVAMQERE